MKGANMSRRRHTEYAQQNPNIRSLQPSWCKIESSNYNIYLHMITNVAKMVAEKLNSKPDFGVGMMDFMKQASIIQVYTQIGNSGDDVLPQSLEVYIHSV